MAEQGRRGSQGQRQGGSTTTRGQQRGDPVKGGRSSAASQQRDALGRFAGNSARRGPETGQRPGTGAR
jgi:hypothetical protein